MTSSFWKASQSPHVAWALRNANLISGYSHSHSMEDHYSFLETILATHDYLMILYHGIMTINSPIRNLLYMEDPYPYELPLLITQNDPVTGLRNGDIGVRFQGSVHFPSQTARDRSAPLLPSNFRRMKTPSP